MRKQAVLWDTVFLSKAGLLHACYMLVEPVKTRVFLPGRSYGRKRLTKWQRAEWIRHFPEDYYHKNFPGLGKSISLTLIKRQNEKIIRTFYYTIFVTIHFFCTRRMVPAKSAPAKERILF
jgi:hypothetical protein